MHSTSLHAQVTHIIPAIPSHFDFFTENASSWPSAMSFYPEWRAARNGHLPHGSHLEWRARHDPSLIESSIIVLAIVLLSTHHSMVSIVIWARFFRLQGDLLMISFHLLYTGWSAFDTFELNFNLWQPMWIRCYSTPINQSKLDGRVQAYQKGEKDPMRHLILHAIDDVRIHLRQINTMDLLKSLVSTRS